MTAIVLVGAVGAVTFARNDDRATPAAAPRTALPATTSTMATPTSSDTRGVHASQTLSAPAGTDSADAVRGRPDRANLVVGDTGAWRQSGADR